MSKLHDYFEYLCEEGRKEYSDLMDDELTTLTGLIMATTPRRDVSEFLTDHSNKNSLIDDCIAFFVSHDMPSNEPTKWLEEHNAKRDQFVESLIKGANEYAKDTIDAMFLAKEEADFGMAKEQDPDRFHDYPEFYGEP